MAGLSSVLLASGGSLDQVLQRAIACHASGQLEEAIGLYCAVLREAPAQPDANHNLGVIHVQAKAVDQSLPYLLAALEAEPAVAQYWLSYIEALLLAGRREDAKLAFTTARAAGLEGENAKQLEQRVYADA